MPSSPGHTAEDFHKSICAGCTHWHYAGLHRSNKKPLHWQSIHHTEHSHTAPTFCLQCSYDPGRCASARVNAYAVRQWHSEVPGVIASARGVSGDLHTSRSVPHLDWADCHHALCRASNMACDE